MPPTRIRKRNRKRKRRNVSSSSSSSPSSPPSEDELPAPPVNDVSEPDSDSDASSSSSSSSVRAVKPGPSSQTLHRSHSPPDTTLPSVIPVNPSTEAEKEKEKALKEKFRKFWMASVAEEFKDDLEQIRKEPNMTTSRLSLFIDALASGADVFSSEAQSGPGNTTNEMEVAMSSSSS